VRVSIESGRTYGEEKWVRETVKDLGLEQTVRPEGRQRKASESATEATSSIGAFHPVVRLLDKPIASRFPVHVESQPLDAFHRWSSIPDCGP
jgi:hypothetical protein